MELRCKLFSGRVVHVAALGLRRWLFVPGGEPDLAQLQLGYWLAWVLQMETGLAEMALAQPREGMVGFLFPHREQ